MVPACTRMECVRWRPAGSAAGERALPEECAISLTYNGGAYAVMMATPQDLEDFAFGFSLTEGIVASIAEIERVQVIEEALGIELRMRLAGPPGAAYAERKRYLAGPTGCGLCGIESLSEAMRPPRKVRSETMFSPDDLMTAMDALASNQSLHRETHAVHAAGLWSPLQSAFLAVREDVGRHNALDKLAGALAQRSLSGADGFVVLTSRVSVEMIQKAAAIGVPLVVAVSAPTALAVRMAQVAGVTLVAIARRDGFETFTHSHRILQQEPAHVA